MKKLLMGEIAALLVLLLVAVFVRLGIGDAAAQPGQDIPQDTQASSLATEVLGPTYIQTEPSETQPSEEALWAEFTEGMQLKAQQYFVYDVDTQKFLTCAGTVDDQVYPASITKLFTAYVALQYLEPDKVLTAKDELEMVAAGSSTARIDWGDKLSVDMLVQGMLLPSGNDAAYVLAANIGRQLEGNSRLHYSDAAIAFVEEMNRQAQELGMTGTHFVNPDGIHKENHYSSYRDLAKIAELALANPIIRKHTSTHIAWVTFASGEDRKWENTNALLDDESKFYCPYAIGLKTGQTPGAGACLLSAFEYEGRTLVVGVFGCAESADRFNDTLTLFHKAIEN